MAGAAAQLAGAVRRGLADAAEPDRAEPMRRYMKSELPFRGVEGRMQGRVFARAFAEHPLATFEEWRDAVLGLWRDAGAREERYGAIALAQHPAYRLFALDLRALPLYEELVVTGA